MSKEHSMKNRDYKSKDSYKKKDKGLKTWQVNKKLSSDAIFQWMKCQVGIE